MPKDICDRVWGYLPQYVTCHASLWGDRFHSPRQQRFLFSNQATKCIKFQKCENKV